MGIVLLGAGVILFSRASLGSAPWDTAILNLESLMVHLNLPISKGTSSLIHTGVLLVFVLILEALGRYYLRNHRHLYNRLY
jgi:uncharacterized membrane protein YczE